MFATRHAWIHASHDPNPFARSLLRPVTIVESEDVDIAWAPPDKPDEKEALACSRHDFLFPYKNHRNEPRIGHGRLFLPPHVETAPARRGVPLVLSIHYEMDQNSAAAFLREGWAVVTPIALSEDHGGNLVGDGMDHTLAMAELVRRFEWVDRQRIAWTGGSAGGYQCLLTLESLWPVACAVANMPVTDLYYTIQYLTHANRYNEGITEVRAQPVPIVQAVSVITTKTREALGEDVDAYWNHSVPLAASLVRCPTVIHFSTADLLCTVNQLSYDYVRPPKRGDFPPGWNMDYRRFCNPHSLGKPLIEWFNRDEVEQIAVAIPTDAPLVDFIPAPEGMPPKPAVKPLVLPRPFSRDKLITIIVQDEGAPTPMCAHTKYVVQMEITPVLHHHFARGYVPSEYLTPGVLLRLLGRFSKEVPQNPTLPPIRRMYDEFDRWEALLSLETFVGKPPRTENVEALARLYSELPPIARALDVTENEAIASFYEDPVAGILWHQAMELRKNGEAKAAEEREEQLTKRHGTSTWARLRTQQSA